MKAALNGRFSGTPQPTGTQTVAFQLFDAIVRTPRDTELVIFADSRFPGVAAWRDFPLTLLVDVPFQDWPRWKAQLWEQCQLPSLCRKWKCDLAHHPITTCPFFQPGVKSVVTLHDLNFLLHPEWFSTLFRLFLMACAIPGMKRASRVVTISNYVLADAKKYLRIPDTRLRMIYNGVKPMAVGPGGAVMVSPQRLLCVGSLQPHKNLARMIRAWLLVRADFPQLELHIVGRPQAQFSQTSELPALLASPGIRLLGYLSEQDLALAYRDATLFCFPSLEEGFGLPILEAMSVGSLVLTSNTSCLPEVAGPAALLADPLSVESLAAGIRLGLTLPAEERASRLKAGKEWASQFSWQEAARQYLSLYKDLA